MSLGNKLKYLREKNNLTQSELAKILNKSRSTIAGYEINDRQPDLDTLQKIAEYFNVSTDYLLDRTLLTNPLDENITYIKNNGEIVTLKQMVDEFIELFESIDSKLLTPEFIDNLINVIKNSPVSKEHEKPTE